VVPLVYDVERAAAEERRVLAESIAGLADDHPDLPVEQQVAHMPAAEALIEQSRSAQLVVVGSRGTRRFHGPAARLGQPGTDPPRRLPRGLTRPAGSSVN
jgi:nucleotide-binding universal stress UspA family protein